MGSLSEPDVGHRITRCRKLSRVRFLVMLIGFLTQPSMAETPRPKESPPVLIAVLATGHVEPRVFHPLEAQIRADMPELADRLAFVQREAGFAESEVIRRVDELASLHPAVLVCLDLFSAGIARMRLRDTHLSIPIVFLAHADPLVGHLIDSYAHPGNNLTGVSTYRCVDPKMLEMLAGALSTRKRIGYLVDASDTSGDNASCGAAAQRAADHLQIELIRLDVSPKDFISTLGEHIKSLRLDAVLAPASAPVWTTRKAVVQTVNDARLPAMYESDLFLMEGGLMSYGPVQTDAIPGLARSVSKILHGASAGDIPVDQPTLLEFVINLGAPHFSEFAVKASALRRADRVLE
jgi:putative tryptophan/tyrosine transport system substrate-binding protein